MALKKKKSNKYTLNTYNKEVFEFMMKLHFMLTSSWKVEINFDFILL